MRLEDLRWRDFFISEQPITCFRGRPVVTRLIDRRLGLRRQLPGGLLQPPVQPFIPQIYRLQFGDSPLARSNRIQLRPIQLGPGRFAHLCPLRFCSVYHTSLPADMPR